ncbi:MAG: CPBP family intramembrane metalloprotease [Paracoccaceae bacterium]|nr:CPBP family intramembrane metalloprotease [Paracoccaceae bacterium]
MTKEFSRFIAPARAFPQEWRLLAGVFLIIFVYLLWAALSALLLWFSVGSEAISSEIAKIAKPKTPTSTLMLFSTFIGLGAGAWVAARVLHRRKGRTLFGRRRQLFTDFIVATLITGAILALFTFGFRPNFEFQTNLAPRIWLSFFPMAIACLIIQTGAEEVVFRGYFMQQLAARFKSPIIWFVLPSVVFGLLHYDPAAGSNIWIIIGATTIFGLMAADLTHQTGGLGAAWGLHFTNNLFAVTLVAMDGGITGLALYTTPFTAANASELFPLLLRDMAVLIAVWMVLRFTLKRRLQNEV